MKTIIAVSVALVFSTNTLANEQEASAGLGGEVGLGMSYFSSDGNMNTSNTNNLTGLNETLGAEAEINPEIIGELNYTFGQDANHQVFVGTNNEEVIQGDLTLEVGYRTQLADDSSVSVSYLTAIVAEETWKDPYVTGAKREVTEISDSGFLVEYANIAGSAVSVDALYYASDVDDEQSGHAELGSINNLLKRSGSGYELGVAYEVALTTDSILTPRLSYGSFSADGEAFSNTSFGGELTYMKAMGKHGLGIQGYYNNVSFDGANPIFDDKKRSDSEFGLAAMYQYDELMGWEDTTLIGLVGYDVKDSDINFYDESEYQLGMAVTYSF